MGKVIKNGMREERGMGEGVRVTGGGEASPGGEKREAKQRS